LYRPEELSAVMEFPEQQSKSPSAVRYQTGVECWWARRFGAGVLCTYV